jgi:uncharacterized protein
MLASCWRFPAIRHDAQAGARLHPISACACANMQNGTACDEQDCRVGNPGNVEPLWLARGLAARGVDVVIPEYRGYGISRSGSAPTEDGLYLDAEATLDEITRRGYDPERVVLWGTSLGSGVAAEMARRHRGAALVLVSPYTSIPALVREHAWVNLPKLLLPDRFDTAAKAGEIHVPTLIVHGDADEVVPFAMGKQLAALIAGASMLRVPAGKHGDLFARCGEDLLDRISSFGR